MIPDQDRALSFAILSQGHEPVQVFPTLDLEFDTDQGVTEVIERPGGQVVDIESLVMNGAV